jgi:hypothetical protein
VDNFTGCELLFDFESCQLGMAWFMIECLHCVGVFTWWKFCLNCCPSGYTLSVVLLGFVSGEVFPIVTRDRILQAIALRVVIVGVVRGEGIC